MISFVTFLVAGCVMATSAQISHNVDDLSFVYYSGPSTRYPIVHNNPSSLATAPFKQNSNVILIIDGYLSNETSPMSVMTKNTFLARSSSNNVIVVNWGLLSGSKTLPHANAIVTAAHYTTVLGNVGPAGQRLADFINFLRLNRGIQFSNVHIIGHSLGAHIAGYAGVCIKRDYNGLLGRITGLDPAGPMFSTQLDPSKRLYKSDAAFVDIYHTNRGTLGDSAHQTGDVNVYVNGGDNQPGCEEADQSQFAGYCSHSYSYLLFNGGSTKSYKACPCSGFQCQCSDCQISCSNPLVLGPNTPTSSTGAYHIRVVL